MCYIETIWTITCTWLYSYKMAPLLHSVTHNSTLRPDMQIPYTFSACWWPTLSNNIWFNTLANVCGCCVIMAISSPAYEQYPRRITFFNILPENSSCVWHISWHRSGWTESHLAYTNWRCSSGSYTYSCNVLSQLCEW